METQIANCKHDAFGVRGSDFLRMPQLKRCRFWLVDDDGRYRQLRQLLMQPYDHLQCSGSFPSADAALARLGLVEAPDVILMDVNMPGTSGIEAIPLVRALAPEVRIILISTFANVAYMQTGLERGASGCLPKSCSCEELLFAIEDAMIQPVPIPVTDPHVASPRVAAGQGWFHAVQSRLGVTLGLR